MAKKPDKHDHPARDMQIHTTGAFCEPLRFRRRDGRITWHWVVTEFTDDFYHNGEVVIPQEEADAAEELFSTCEDEGE